MWSEPIVTVAAASEPVSLAEARAHCRVTSDSHDTALALYIASARDFAEKYTGLHIASQTAAITSPKFVSGGMPIAPIQSIVSIKYQDNGNTEQTLPSAVYDFAGAGTLRPVLSLAEGQSWPDTYSATEAVTLTAVVGYTETPAAIKHAMLLMIGFWFDNRETVTGAMAEPPFAATALLENYRTF